MEKRELLSSPVYNKRVPAKQGRRAHQPPVDDDIGSPDDLLDSPPSGFSPAKGFGLRGEPIAPPRSRKTGGWADELSAKSRGSRKNSTNIIEQERFQSPERKTKPDSDDEIPLIPDMDELQDDELQVARAPSVAATKMASFSELDSKLETKFPFSTLGSVNLSLLTSHFYSKDDVLEPDNAWMWDRLFTEVASDLRSEWDAVDVKQ